MIDFDEFQLANPEVVKESLNTPMNQILPPTEITGPLFLGSYDAVFERETLLRHNITHVLAVFDRPHHDLKADEAFNLLHVDLDDVIFAAAEFRSQLEKMYAFIDGALKENHGVLVHCYWVCTLLSKID